MRALTYTLEALARRHRAVIGVWLATVAISLPFALRQSDHLFSGGLAVAGSQSAKVDTTLERNFPSASRSTLDVLLYPRKGATAEAIRADVKRVGRALNGIPDVSLDIRDREAVNFAAGLVEPTLLPLHITGDIDTAQNIAGILRVRLGLDTSRDRRVEIHLLGEGALWAGLEDASKRDLSHAELVGFPIVVIVLLVIFGSLAAAMLPAALGLVAVVVTGALIYLLSLSLRLSVFVTDTASLLGIGVAVDYSLIILSRVRQELREGSDLDSARRTALRTAGVTVIFSGATVIASLIGLAVVPSGALRSMALGAIVVVAIAVVAAVTLLPALITLLGDRRLSTGRFSKDVSLARSRAGAGAVVGWDRWANLVMRRPVCSIVAVSTILLALCIPTLNLRMSVGVLSQLGKNDETRVGFDEAQKLAGPGALDPIYLTVGNASGATRIEFRARVQSLWNEIKRLPGIASLRRVQMSRDGNQALLLAIPRLAPESLAAMALVERLRRLLTNGSETDGLAVAVGGASAVQLDEVSTITTSMWKVFVAVLVVAFLTLVVLLRSIVLPLKAIVMNLLSVGAAYGVLVVVFQWGWLDSLLHYESRGYLETLTPPLVLAIVFGLSMDYEVFLLMRIRERWLATGDPHTAVAEGLAASARTISSAAFVLVCVFSVFIATGVPAIKELGVGGAVAIGIDATLVRLILVPAMMELLGGWNWWLPRRLERLLPGDLHEIFLDPCEACSGEQEIAAGSR